MRFFSYLIASLFLAGMTFGERGFARELSLEERRSENDRIQAVMRRTVLDNKQPDPEGAPRITRVLRNSYRNVHPPQHPKTIYRFPIRPPFPTGYKRFFGGIPR